MIEGKDRCRAGESMPGNALFLVDVAYPDKCFMVESRNGKEKIYVVDSGVYFRRPIGFYDVFKKKSLRGNAVIPVLFLNTLFCSLIFLPFILGSAWGMTDTDSLFYIPPTDWGAQKYILLKSCIVLSSWIFGYFGMKHLPLTIVGPINATRPVMVLVGALLVFGERLNLYQWVGVALAVLSFFMLSRSGKKKALTSGTTSGFISSSWPVYSEP